MTTAAIHHDDTASESPPMRAAVAAARVHVIRRSSAVTSSHSTGAGAIIKSAVALTAPIENTTRAARAAWRQRVRVAASTVSPTSQPRPAHGSSIADVRETYGSRYGESWNTTAAVNAAPKPSPSRRAHHSTPVPASRKRVPIHSRWATQSGTFSRSKAQYHGPCGHRYAITWWGTHPANWRPSNVHGASAIRRPGSRYRYSLVSAGIRPGDDSRDGT